MAIFEAIPDSSVGIKWSGFSSAYAASLLQVLKATSDANLKNVVQYLTGGGFPFYTQVYKAGSPGFPFFDTALATNAALVVGKNFVSALAYGFNDFKVGFENEKLKIEGSIRALQAALGPRVGSGSLEDPVEWWTLYDINLQTSELTSIAEQYLLDLDASGQSVAAATAVKSLKSVNRDLFAGDDQVILTNKRDIFLSYQGNDVVKALKGADRIAPGLGSDSVDCGADKAPDEVILVDAKKSTPKNVAGYLRKAGVDTILQFRSEDQIVVSKKTLGLGVDVGSSGKASAADLGLIFYGGNQLDSPAIRFRYDSGTGSLEFDADGSGAAGPVQIASLFKDGAGQNPANFSTSDPLSLFISA